MEYPLSLFVAFLAVFCMYILMSRGRIAGLPYPPGPEPSLIFGNMHQLPKKNLWLTFMSWSKIYGPIFHFRLLSKRTVVINSAKIAFDLLERRSAIYSDRPQIWMAGELVGRHKSVFLTSSNDPRFKIYRKLLQAGLNTRVSHSYRPIQYEERNTFLKSLLSNPDNFIAHIRRNAAAVIMKVAYGYQINSDDDIFIGIIERGSRIMETLSTPGKFLVEFMPFLRFVPDWIPGADFKRLTRDARVELRRIEEEPFSWAEQKIASGHYVESFISKFLCPENGSHPDACEIDIIKWASGGLYAGGADTTVSALTSFFYLMALHPDIQKRAQIEIDQFTEGRLPTLDDYKAMPYIKAMIQEIVRWGPVAPLGISHRVTEDDVYEGYLISKGTRVIANIWAMTHDEEIYPDPSRFDPSRHLGDDPQVDPFKFVFGFGRRSCPGAHLAEMSLFLNISSILAIFDILKPLDHHGCEYEPITEFQSTSATIHLKPFPCRVVPRSEKDIMHLIS